MKKKIMKLFAVILVAGMVFTGCGAKGGSESGSQGSATSGSASEVMDTEDKEDAQNGGDKQEPADTNGSASPQKPEDEGDSQAPSKTEDAPQKPEDKPADTNGSANQGGNADETIAKSVITKFVGAQKSSTEAIANALLDNPKLDFGPATMPVEPGFLNGFKSEIAGFKSGTMFGPMIGTIPFIGYVFELDGSVGADEFINNLKSNADLRWNVCTEADDMEAAKDGNFVVFVMAPRSFEE